jgi:rhodanese-related sulfurtransferase
MPASTVITVPELARLIGLPDSPAVVDVRLGEDYRADPRLLPGSTRRDFLAIGTWAAEYRAKNVIVVCQRGQKLSEGTAAWLRHEGIEAQTLEGGFAAWRKAGEPLLRTDNLPAPDDKGRTVWVTRLRPKVDRIACPWLIRRFIDPNAVFLFVPPLSISRACSGVIVVIPAPSTRCSRNLASDPNHYYDWQRSYVARIRLGYSRMYRDDLAQLEAAMGLYDAFYRWCRDAAAETHNWPSNKPVA